MTISHRAGAPVASGEHWVADFKYGRHVSCLAGCIRGLIMKHVVPRACKHAQASSAPSWVANAEELHPRNFCAADWFTDEVNKAIGIAVSLLARKHR
jgi:hypothetical protein